MGRWTTQNIEGLLLSMKELEEIPGDVIEDMLDAGAAVAVESHKASLRALGLLGETKNLINNIEAHKKNDMGRRYILIYPTGTHHKYHAREITKTYKNSKSGRTYTVGGRLKNTTNQDVGFIHEYGAPNRNIPAKQWMRKANDACADAVAQAELDVYDTWLKSKNL